MTARPLLDELRRHAAQEIQAARDRAEAEAEGIRGAARAESEARAATARAQLARTVAQEASVAAADALRRMNQRLLPARATALDRVFARTLAKVEGRATHPGVADAIAALTRDALEYLPDGAVRARCASSCVGAVRRALDLSGRGDSAVVADESVPVGVIVESGDGAIAVDATFARRLARQRGALATEIAHQLLEPAP